MSDTGTFTYTLRVYPAGPDDDGNDDGMRFGASIAPSGGDELPLRGYGETAVEAAGEVVAHYVEDPPG